MVDNRDRWVLLDGAANVRDLGDLPTIDGRWTARRRVLRADNLQQLSERDVRRLVGELGVRVVVDLRTSVEVEKEGPGPLTRQPQVTIRHCSLFPEGGQMTDVEADAVLPWQTGERVEASFATGTGHPAIGYYLGYLRDRPDSVAAALRVLAGPGEPDAAAIVHCAAGKDRTGVVVALALEAVGVTREAVVADYVATGDRLDAILDRLRRSATYAGDLDDRPVDTHRPQADIMRRFLAILDERYGGAMGWLAGAGFGSTEVAALRARLVA